MFMAQLFLTIALLILADKLEDNLSLIVRLISSIFCIFTFCVFTSLYAFVWKWHNKNRALRRYKEVKKFNLEVMRSKRARIVTPKYFIEPWMAFRPLTSYHPDIYTSQIDSEQPTIPQNSLASLNLSIKDRYLNPSSLLLGESN